MLASRATIRKSTEGGEIGKENARIERAENADASKMVILDESAMQLSSSVEAAAAAAAATSAPPPSPHHLCRLPSADLKQSAKGMKCAIKT